jgi:hypothetical protein
MADHVTNSRSRRLYAAGVPIQLQLHRAYTPAGLTLTAWLVASDA